MSKKSEQLKKAAAAKNAPAANKPQAQRKGNAKEKETPTINETPEEQPVVIEASEGTQPGATSNETSTETEVVTETLTEEHPDEKETPDPVKEAQELISKQTDRSLTVFWHKVCTDPKKVTKTTLYANETLKKTDGTVTLPNPLFKDAETTPDEPLTITKDVYSLKRGKRIYYLHDVTPTDILKAKLAKEASDKKKAEEAAASESAAK